MLEAKNNWTDAKYYVKTQSEELFHKIEKTYIENRFYLYSGFTMMFAFIAFVHSMIFNNQETGLMSA